MKLAPSGGIPPSRDPSAETAQNGIHAPSILAAAPAVPNPLIAHSTSPAPRVRQRVASPMTHMVEPMGSAVAMQQIQALREEVRTEYQAQSRMLCQIDAVLRRELQTCRKVMFDLVMAEMEKARASLKEEADERKALADQVDSRFTELADTIAELGEEDNPHKLGQAPDIMSTLAEDTEQEFLARLDEALETESFARRELERNLSGRLDLLSHQVLECCDLIKQALFDEQLQGVIRASDNSLRFRMQQLQRRMEHLSSVVKCKVVSTPPRRSPTATSDAVKDGEKAAAACVSPREGANTSSEAGVLKGRAASRRE